MSRAARWLTLGLILVIAPAGCRWLDLGPWGGPAYTLDTEKVGTGQQAITPRNDAGYADGQALDCRTRR